MGRIETDNRIVTGDELLRDLRQGLTPDRCALVGAVKQSGDGQSGDVLFTRDFRGSLWVQIPVTLVERVEILGQVRVGSENCRHVRLHLRANNGHEATVLARILGQLESAAGRRRTPHPACTPRRGRRGGAEF